MRSTLAVMLGLLLVALPAQGYRAADSKTMTIRLVSITTKFTLLVDQAPKGVPNKGDVLRAKSTLRNRVPQFGKPKNAIVGSDVATYTVVSATQADVKVAARLPGGMLRSAGRIRDGDPTQTIRVTGGTGIFAGARGTNATSPLPGKDRALNVYRLQLR